MHFFEDRTTNIILLCYYHVYSLRTMTAKDTGHFVQNQSYHLETCVSEDLLYTWSNTESLRKTFTSIIHTGIFIVPLSHMVKETFCFISWKLTYQKGNTKKISHDLQTISWGHCWCPTTTMYEFNQTYK